MPRNAFEDNYDGYLNLTEEEVEELPPTERERLIERLQAETSLTSTARALLRILQEGKNQ